MRAKSLLLLLVALGCGVVASVAVSQIVLDKGEKVQTAEILVVTKNISTAAKLTADSVKLEKWPVEKIPQGALVDLKQVEGKFAKQPLYANEPLVEIKLANKGKELIVPDGYRVFDLVVNDHTGGSGYISPGDRVDVFGYFDKVKVAGNKSVRVMENLEVWMVDGIAVVDPDAPASSRRGSSTFQLLVKDKQYGVLDTAHNLGRLRVALRPPEKDGGESKKQDDGELFMSWLNKNESTKVASTSISSEGTFEVPVNRVEHVMTIVTPESVNRFQWRPGDREPQKVDSTDGNFTSITPGMSTSGIQSGAQPAAVPPHMQDPTAGTPPAGIPATTKSPPPKQPNSPNMNWDATTGTWQVGGFKPTYPTSQ